jgi:hypothetical protein
MKAIIKTKGLEWCAIVIFSIVLFAGIVVLLQIPQAKDDFDKAFAIALGGLLSAMGSIGLIIFLFREKGENFLEWFYAIGMCLTCIGGFIAMIVCGILNLFGVKI